MPPNVIEEFFAPDQGLEIAPYLEAENMMGIHHLARYHWAKEVLDLLKPASVLDIACGAGYGSYIFANRMVYAAITGADYDPRAIKVARESYQHENLSYVTGDLVSWTAERDGQLTGLGKYDVVVSFDTIEHIAHRDIAFIRITENINENGVLLLSTPCGHQESVLTPEWEAHKLEYSYKDLQNLLRRFFKVVLIPEDGSLPGLDYWNDEINKDKLRYLNLTNPVFCSHPIKY